MEVFVRESNQKIEVVVSDDKLDICSYVFQYKTEASGLGGKIIRTTLLRYALLDCLLSSEFNIHAQLNEFEKEYLFEEIERFISYSKVQHGLKIPTPKIEFSEPVINVAYPSMRLDINSCYIGYSGGKDSYLSYELIKDRFSDVKKFKIDFDDEAFFSEFHETYHVHDLEKYNGISAKSFYETNGKDYYQEEDLHCCFAAPYFNVKDQSPATLSIGLQFDVSNYYVFNNDGKRILEFDLSESYDSIKNFEKLLHQFGLVDFKIIVPLASMTSFSIYQAIIDSVGEDKLREMNSCWYPGQGNSHCGKCMKCKRVSFIYKCIGMETSEFENSSILDLYINNVSLAYLFGSNTIEALLKGNHIDRSDLSRVIFTDDKVNELDHGLSAVIEKRYGMSIMPNPLKGVL